jgi:pyruvate ferredoxin oxidoreductase delta subunit
MSEIKSLRDLGIWIISKPGKAASGITGTWRTFRPVINRGKCNKCMVCWLYCPEGVISRDVNGYPRIDYEFCKGCGICAYECRVKAIDMVEEVR